MGTPWAKVGTPADAARCSARGGKRRRQPFWAVLPDKSAYMTVFVGHTEATVPSVPTFFPQNRFPTRGLYMTWSEGQGRARTRVARASNTGLVACRRQVGTAGTPGTARRRACRKVADPRQGRTMRLLERHCNRLPSGRGRPPADFGHLAVGADSTAAATDFFPGNSQEYGDFREHCGSPAAPPLGWCEVAQPAASSPAVTGQTAARRGAEVVMRNPGAPAVSQN